jgi:hypothetical protein
MAGHSNRIRDACRAVEDWHGLRQIAPADRTAAGRPKRAETEKAARADNRKQRAASCDTASRPRSLLNQIH